MITNYLPRRHQRERTPAELRERGHNAQRMLEPGSVLSEAFERVIEEAIREWVESDDEMVQHNQRAILRAIEAIERALVAISNDGAVAR